MEKEKKNKKKEKKVNGKYVVKSRLDVKFKLLLNIILITTLFLGSIYMLFMANNIDVEDKEKIISYKEESNINYEVSLKNNPYYQTPILGMNQQYPSSLIDKINITYNYKFNTDKESDYQYRYFATATLIADNKTNEIIADKTNKNLLTRTYQLQNEVSSKVSNSKEYAFKKTYSINYDYYNNFITNYKKQYNLSIDAYIKVNLYIEIIDTYNDNVINVAKNMEVNIPLLQNTIGITINNPKDVNNTIYVETNKVTSNTFFIIFAIVMLISSILLFIQEIKKVLISDKEQSKYINKLNKILSTNSEVIVKVKNEINLKNSNIIDVENINELLDAQNELRIPIAYFETKKNKEGCFVIVNGKEAWRYILTLEDE